MPTQKLTPEIINAAILGFEEQKRQIDTLIAELRGMLLGGSTEPGATPEGPKTKRRKMTAAARKRIGDAQRKRWAESKGEPESPAKVTKKRKRKLSAAGKAAIVAALKKRWAAKRAAAKKATPAVTTNRVAKRATAKKVANAPVKAAAKKTPQKKVASAARAAE